MRTKSAQKHSGPKILQSRTVEFGADSTKVANGTAGAHKAPKNFRAR